MVRGTWDGRHYDLAVCTEPTQVSVQLNDFGPQPGRGTVAVLTYPHDGAEPHLAIRVPNLPLALVREFINEADSWVLRLRG